MIYDLRFKNKKTIQSFEDLIAWKEGHALVILIYKITKKFPNDEIFGLISQMKRASTSVTYNIAEGFGRQTYKEKIQFYYLSQGSLTELKSQITIARDVGYLNTNDYMELIIKANFTHKLLHGLIKKSKLLSGS